MTAATVSPSRRPTLPRALGPPTPGPRPQRVKLGTCPKCLHLKTSSGSFSNKVHPCHVRTSKDKKDQFNLLCTTHKKVNYRICTLCPAGKKPHDMRSQKVVLSFIAHVASHPVLQSLSSPDFSESLNSDSE